MKRLFRRPARALATVVVLAVVALGSAIAFDSPSPPPAVPGSGVLPGMDKWDKGDIPPVQRLLARDGAPLTYRAYPGRPGHVAVLVHGSTGTGLDMHKLAQALQAAGATVYTVSLRGHGGSGTASGDVSYVGQLDDDLADLVKGLGLDKPGIKRTLVGFSAGGGFALRTASGGMRRSFDNYIVISPYVAAFTATAIVHRHMGPWANYATLRVAGLLLLEELGLDWFQDLPVVRYAVDPRPDDRHTPAYTYRMVRSLHMGIDRRRELARVDEPTVILTSDADDLSNAKRLGSVGNPHIQFRQIARLEHDEMVVDPKATAAVVEIWRKLDGL